MKKRTKESKKRLSTLILLVAFMAVLLITSIYAWFTSQRDVTIANLRGQVQVSEDFEISLDAEHWYHYIDLADLANDTDTATGNEKNVVPSFFTPVSCDGKIVDNALKFYSGTYTVDGNKKTLKDISADGTEGRFVEFDLYFKDTSLEGASGKTTRNLVLKNDSTVGWTESLSGIERMNSMAKNEYDTYGLQNSVRVGIAKYALADGTTSISNLTTDPATIKAAFSNNVEDFCIWEPNANKHSDYAVNSVSKNFNLGLKHTNKNGVDGKTNPNSENYYDFTSLLNAGTPAKILGADKGNVASFAATDVLPTYAIKNGATVKGGSPEVNLTYDDIYNWNDDNPTSWASNNGKLLNLQLANQTGENISTDVKLQSSNNSTITYNAEANSNAGEYQIEWNEFAINANQITRCRVFVWLEGQDVDNANWATNGKGFDVNLHMEKEETN